MKKILTLLLLSLVFIPSLMLLNGCSSAQNIDGIELSNVEYTLSPISSNTGDELFKLTYSCKVKNTTDEDLQFQIVYSGRFGGIFSSLTTSSETVVLLIGESKTLTYVVERVTKVYSKNIEIFQVTAYVES